jgi:hypothetical protein
MSDLLVSDLLVSDLVEPSQSLVPAGLGWSKPGWSQPAGSCLRQGTPGTGTGVDQHPYIGSLIIEDAGDVVPRQVLRQQSPALRDPHLRTVENPAGESGGTR